MENSAEESLTDLTSTQVKYFLNNTRHTELMAIGVYLLLTTYNSLMVSELLYSSL